MQKQFPPLVFVFLSLAILSGCAQKEAGPSYADLVVTYNAELATLDRLESKRAKLVADFSAATQPAPAGAGQLEDLLKAASKISAESGGLDPSADPNELLDQLAERSGATQDIASQLLEGIGGEAAAAPAEKAAPTEEEIAERAKFDASLAEIDKEIEEQKARVDKARSMRDAASAADEAA